MQLNRYIKIETINVKGWEVNVPIEVKQDAEELAKVIDLIDKVDEVSKGRR